MPNLVRAFFIYKALVLALAFVAIAAVAQIWIVSPSHFITLFYEWDAKHIIRVASQGYLAGEPSAQIFPVTPAIIRLFHLVIWNWEWAGFIATQAMSFLAFYYFYRLARLDLDETDSLTALILFATFPTAYFLTAPYSEAPFCAITFALVYYLRKAQFKQAAFFGLLTGAARVTGVLFGPALALSWLLSKKQDRGRLLKGYVTTAACIGLGYFLCMCMYKYLYDDWFYYSKYGGKVWGVHVSWPFKGVVAAMSMWPARGAADRMTTIILEIGFTLGALAMLPVVYRRRPKMDFIYMALTLAVLVSMDFWLSRPRYILPLYPMFLVAAPWFRNAPLRLSLYLLSSGGLFAIYWALYLKAQWAH